MMSMMMIDDDDDNDDDDDDEDDDDDDGSGKDGTSLRELCFANERHPEDWRVRKRLGSRVA